MPNELPTLIQTNLNSDVQPSQLLNEVLKAGKLHIDNFIIASFSQKRLQENRTGETLQVLATILVQAAMLAGIKEGIQDMVKEDLKDLIFGRFGYLSLEEVAYAFKLERQLVYDTKSEHFQFFSTEYVAEILNKYIQWKRLRIREKRLTKPETMLPENTKSDTEKVNEYFSYLGIDFQYYKDNGSLQFGAIRHYLPLYYLGLLPNHTQEFRAQINERAIGYLKKEMSLSSDPTEKRDIRHILEGKIPAGGKMKVAAKTIILTDFFQGLIEQQKDLSDVLREKTQQKTPSQILECILKK